MGLASACDGWGGAQVALAVGLADAAGRLSGSTLASLEHLDGSLATLMSAEEEDLGYNKNVKLVVSGVTELQPMITKTRSMTFMSFESKIPEASLEVQNLNLKIYKAALAGSSPEGEVSLPKSPFKFKTYTSNGYIDLHGGGLNEALQPENYAFWLGQNNNVILNEEGKKHLEDRVHNFRKFTREFFMLTPDNLSRDEFPWHEVTLTEDGQELETHYIGEQATTFEDITCEHFILGSKNVKVQAAETHACKSFQITAHRYNWLGKKVNTMACKYKITYEDSRGGVWKFQDVKIEDHQ